MTLEHFFGNVTGLSLHNGDGTRRQDIIPRCRVGEQLVLEHECDHPLDVNAVRVLRQNGEQIGYLEQVFADQVVLGTAKGQKFHAAIAGIGRPHLRAPYGVALLIVASDSDVSDAEVDRYVREILRRDRPSATAVARRAHGRPLVDWLLLRMLIVIAVSAVAVVVANGSFSPFD